MARLPQSRPVYQEGEHILYLHGLQLRGEKDTPESSGEGPVAAAEVPALPSGLGPAVLLDFDASAVRAETKIGRIQVAAVKRPDAGIHSCCLLSGQFRNPP